MAAFILFPGPVFQGLRETACPIFIVGQAIFETTVIDLHGQIIIMLYYFLAQFTIKTLQPLTSMSLLR